MISRRSFIKTSASCLAVASAAGQSAFLWGQNETLRVRKNLQELSPDSEFFKQYGAAIRLLHELPKNDARQFFNQATIHANYCKHGDINFFSWHRPYVAMFEEICGHIIGDSTFALPYWDWSTNGGRIPKPYYSDKYLNVVYWKDSGKYVGKNWGPVDSLPDRANLTSDGVQALYKGSKANPFTADFLTNVLKTPDFSLFHTQIESQPHNNAHVIAGTLPRTSQFGHMGDGLSPLDPIFWNHHCMVDFLWAEWQMKGYTTKDNDETYSNMFCDRHGKPISFTNQSVRNFYSLGYTYDKFVLRQGLQGRLSKLQVETPEQTALAQRLNTAVAKSLGANIQPINVNSQSGTKITIIANNVRAHLKESRVILHNESGLPELREDGKRIYAVLKGVSWPKNDRTDFLVIVSVVDTHNSEETPLEVGSFSFFGSAKMLHHGHDIVIDITDGVAQLENAGRLTETLTLRLSTQSSYLKKSHEADFDFQGVEIISL